MLYYYASFNFDVFTFMSHFGFIFLNLALNFSTTCIVYICMIKTFQDVMSLVLEFFIAITHNVSQCFYIFKDMALNFSIRPVQSTGLLDFTEFHCFFVSWFLSFFLYQCMVTVLKLHWPPSTFACKCLSTLYIFPLTRPCRETMEGHQNQK